VTTTNAVVVGWAGQTLMALSLASGSVLWQDQLAWGNDQPDLTSYASGVLVTLDCRSPVRLIQWDGVRRRSLGFRRALSRLLVGRSQSEPSDACRVR